MDKRMLDLLHRSFDQKLSLKEQRELDGAIKNSQDLQKEKQQIESLRLTLAGSKTQAFKPFFAERVTNKIADLGKVSSMQKDFVDSLNYIFKRVVFIGSAATIILFSVNIMENKSNPVPQAQVSSEVTLEEDILTSYLTTMEDVL